MRLTPESEQIVAATAGVVAAHAEQITRVFYPDMFAAHPTLLRVFNKANQAIGEQPQALAASVVAFAVQLIDPDAPDFTPAMQRIAHKHVSLGIRAAEYTIVGHHLLKAVKTVLGDAITPEIARGLGQGLLAVRLLADRRGGQVLRSRAPTPPSRGASTRVVERFEESEDVFSLLLAPVRDVPPIARDEAWRSPSTCERRAPTRQYTISSRPQGDSLPVTIKRVRGVDGNPDGQVSGWLHANALPGSVLDVSQPAGDLVLATRTLLHSCSSPRGSGSRLAAIAERISRRQPERKVRLFHTDKFDQHALYAALRRQVLAMSDPFVLRCGTRRRRRAPHPAPRPRSTRTSPTSTCPPTLKGVHVRPAGVHARGAVGSDGEGHPQREHPLRGVRSVPLGAEPGDRRRTERLVALVETPAGQADETRLICLVETPAG
ncbi:MAG: globin domain-containing protein [Micropruina glycogenica]